MLGSGLSKVRCDVTIDSTGDNEMTYGIAMMELSRDIGSK